MIFTDIIGIGDPQIVLFEGKYYCYATHGSDGFDVWMSDDLCTWKGPIRCFDAAKSWGKSHFWAPEVVYHNGRFVMHYTAMSRELNSLRLGVAVADSPTGPFTDVHDEPMFDFGYAAIDGSVLISDKGNFLYYSRDCNENVIDEVHTSQIYCVELDDSLTETVGEPELMTTPTEDYELLSKTNPSCLNFIWNEGPTVIEYSGKFLMNYSANFYASNDYAICLATSDSPTGPWIKSPKNPVLSRNAELFGAGHNAFFKNKNGELMTSFHIQTYPEKPSGNRRVVIGKVTFTEVDGEIIQKIE